MWISQLFEDDTRHVTFCFGRMNPPTIGHKQVFDTMKSVGGDYLIFLSKTQNPKKDPLDYDTKVDFVKKILPEYADRIVDEPSLRTPWQVASYLYDLGYRHATFVGGDDRKQMYEQLKQFNGVEGKPHGYYKFDTFDFESAGAREEGASGLAGVSATVARQAAADGDLKAFAKATGAGEHAEELYAAVRQGMGITEKEPAEVTEQTNKPNPVAKNMERFNRPQTHKDRKKAMKRGDEKHKGKDMQFSDIQHESYYDDVDPEVAKLGRILMDKAVSQKDENLSGIMATVGSELTKFGSNQGARDLKQLEKRVGLPEAMIKKMMEYAAKFEDETKYRVKDPEPGADDMEDEDFRESAVQESMPETAEELRDKIDEISSMLERQVEHPMTDLTDDKEGRMLVSIAQRALSNLAQYADSLGEMSEGVVEGSHSVLDTLQSIVDDKQKKTVRFTDGKMPVDMFTASAVMQVYDAVNDDNKSKIKDAVQTKSGFMKIAEFAMSKAKSAGSGAPTTYPGRGGSTQRESDEELPGMAGKPKEYYGSVEHRIEMKKKEIEHAKNGTHSVLGPEHVPELEKELEQLKKYGDKIPWTGVRSTDSNQFPIESRKSKAGKFREAITHPEVADGTNIGGKDVYGVDMFYKDGILQDKDGVYKITNPKSIKKMLDAYAKSVKAKGESVAEDSKFDRNFEKRIAAKVKGGKGAEYMSKKADQAQDANPDKGKGIGPGVLDTAKARKKAKEKGVKAPGSLRASPNTRDPKRLPESCADCGKPRFVSLPEEIQAKYESINEAKQKGVDGKVCWKGYKRMGTKKKGGKTVDNCVKMSAAEKNK